MGIKLKKRINAVLPSTNKALRRFLVSLTILNASSTYQVQAATTTTTSTTTTAASATTTAPSTTTTATGAAQSSITVDKVQGDYDLKGISQTLTDPGGAGTIKSSSAPTALTINATVNTDFLGVIDNTINGLTLTGSGKFGFAKDQTYTGTTTINFGAYLQVSASGTTGSIASTNVVNNGKISFTRSNPYTYAGVISGTGTLHQYKLNTLTLTGANTSTGATTIDAGGTLIGDISKSVGVEINGTYDLNGTARTLINPSGTGTIKSSGTPAALTITSQNDSTFSGTLVSTLSDLTKNGAGTLTLSNTTPYAGPVTVSSGTLALTNSSSLSGTIKLSQNATLAIKALSTTATGTTATGTTATGTTATGTTATGTTATGTTATGTTATGTVVITNPITFGSDATGTNPTVTLNVSQPTTFSGAITCNAPSGTTVTLAITGGYPVTFTGTQTGTFKIAPSGEN